MVGFRPYQIIYLHHTLTVITPRNENNRVVNNVVTHLVVLFGRSAARIQVNVFVWASKLSVHPLRRKNSNKNVSENWSTKPVWNGGVDCNSTSIWTYLHHTSLLLSIGIENITL
jgi:hypothetical protein